MILLYNINICYFTDHINISNVFIKQMSRNLWIAPYQLLSNGLLLVKIIIIERKRFDNFCLNIRSNIKKYIYILLIYLTKNMFETLYIHVFYIVPRKEMRYFTVLDQITWLGYLWIVWTWCPVDELWWMARPLIAPNIETCNKLHLLMYNLRVNGDSGYFKWMPGFQLSEILWW